MMELLSTCGRTEESDADSLPISRRRGSWRADSVSCAVAGWTLILLDTGSTTDDSERRVAASLACRRVSGVSSPTYGAKLEPVLLKMVRPVAGPDLLTVAEATGHAWEAALRVRGRLEAGDRDGAQDEIFRFVRRCFENGETIVVNSLCSTLHSRSEQWPVEVQVGLLMATRPHRTRLPARADLFDALLRRVCVEKGPDRADRMLKGLR